MLLEKAYAIHRLGVIGVLGKLLFWHRTSENDEGWEPGAMAGLLVPWSSYIWTRDHPAKPKLSLDSGAFMDDLTDFFFFFCCDNLWTHSPSGSLTGFKSPRKFSSVVAVMAQEMCKQQDLFGRGVDTANAKYQEE